MRRAAEGAAGRGKGFQVFFCPGIPLLPGNVICGDLYMVDENHLYVNSKPWSSFWGEDGLYWKSTLIHGLG